MLAAVAAAGGAEAEASEVAAAAESCGDISSAIVVGQLATKIRLVY
jgi:hypothetical protein